MGLKTKRKWTSITAALAITIIGESSYCLFNAINTATEILASLNMDSANYSLRSIPLRRSLQVA
jgi:hypothetical protein